MLKDKKFLITGSNGQLAKAFVSYFKKHGLDFLALPKGDLDITNRDQIKATINTYRPDVLINCAAYNLVDKAEEEPEKAFEVNSEAVHYLASACKENGIFFVHFSSDYVFDGQKEDAYVEEDQSHPINVYGQSKLKGEENVRTDLENYLIFRLSWVFGHGQQNFLHKLSQWAQNRKTLEVIDDKISAPTYTEDVVRVVLLALQKGLKGTYHLSNSGPCSRCEWAQYYFKKKGMDTEIHPVASGHFQEKAERPDYSYMSNRKICDALDISIPTWQEAVDRIINSERKLKNVTI